MGPVRLRVVNDRSKSRKNMNEEQILEEAASWSARLAAPDCSAADRADFERWHDQNEAHAAAYAAAVALSEQLSASDDARLRAMADAAYALGTGIGQPKAYRSRRWAKPLALAAGMATVAVGIHLAPPLAQRVPAAVTYITATGEQRDLTLADGSLVHLDVASELQVRMAEHERRIELIKGRALFEVAHDSNRPFSVTAGGVRTTALGTVFQVQRQEKQILVTLSEGSVSVVPETDRAAHQERLRPGEQISFDTSTAAWNKHDVDPEIATSWSRQRHIFRSTPLGEALEEINRYSAKKVRLADQSLSMLPVSGNFITGDSALIVSAFSAVLPVRAIEGSDEIILVHRYDGNGG